ncbi:type II secretion system F family protein [Nocardioides sp.]|uniref:type II secretion system F family protein n=1 Tax=Nocardioides sp. TaxID=35761 RepID=UPI002CB4FA6F|nr:type II secretion system F family protein [Nocardioides sp.]HXH77984.1 type II secretion system F family protein [Nocardioides sp.]
MILLRWRPRAAALASLAALTVLSVAPAMAADEVTIDFVETTDGVVSMVVSVDGVPGASVGESDVSVQINGEAVDAKAKAVAAGDVTRTSILVVDASNSMRGAKFDAATDAVTAFLATAPPDVQIGMVAFAGTVGTVVPPTTDRQALLEEFTGLELAAGTGVYDAVAEALELAGSEGSRSLLLLSDGADTGSTATLDEVAKAAVEAEVVIDVVSIGGAAKADALNTFADETSGQVIPAEAEALAAVVADQAQALAQQLLVSVELPDGVSGDADITVSVEGVGTSFDDSVFVNVGERAKADTGPTSTVVEAPLVSTPVMLAGAGALFLGLAVLLWAMLSGGSGRKSSVDKRLDVYFGGGETKGGRRSADAPGMKDSAVALTGRMVNDDLETKIAKRLAGAGSSLTVAEWVLLHGAIAVGTAVVFFFLLSPLMAVLGLLLGIVLPWVYLKWRHSRRLNAFNGQLAETLGLMAGGLQAGLSLPQAVDTVVREGIEPMAGELRRALVEQRLGVDIAEGLEGVGERMESDDFAWVVMAIRIQREIGGNLAEILNTVADTLREREYLRRQVKALSAEGRLSGYILTGMPPFIMVYLSFANREYIEVLWSTAIGWIILAIAGVMLLMGGMAMSKLAKVEV